MSAFTPQQEGGRSRREVVFDAIKGRDTGSVIRYEEMPYEHSILVGLRTSVAKLMEREQSRTLVCVPSEGWMIVSGVDHINQAARTRKQATRRLGRAVHLAESVDRRDLSGEEQRRADAELISTKTGYGVLRGLANKAGRIGLDEIRDWQQTNEPEPAA